MNTPVRAYSQEEEIRRPAEYTRELQQIACVKIILICCMQQSIVTVIHKNILDSSDGTSII